MNSRPICCYPFGSVLTGEKELSREGYTWAFLAGSEVDPVHFDDNSLDRYAVPRTIVYHWNFSQILAALKKNLNRTETGILPGIHPVKGRKTARPAALPVCS